MLKIGPFEQGRNGGQAQPKMPRYVKATISLYHRLDPKGKRETWEVVNSSTLPVEIQASQRIGIWTPDEKEADEPPKNKEPASYLCVPFQDLQKMLLPGWNSSSPLDQIL